MGKHMTRLLVIFAIGLITGCGGAPPARGAGASVAGGTAAEFQEADVEIETFNGDQLRPRRPHVIRREGVPYQPWHLEFDSAESCTAFSVGGVHVLTRIDKWADVFIPAQGLAFNMVTRSKGLVRIEGGYPAVVPPPMPAAPAESRAVAEPTARGGVGTLRGKGVIIAVVDSGLDFRHPDFIATDASGMPASRVLALWDTTSNDFVDKGVGSQAPATWPTGRSLGTLYTRDQLTAELRSSEKKIGVTDANGHGTACASIAAGNGRGNGTLAFTGVAPEADLIGVRIGGTAGRGLENVYLLNTICAWVDSIAEGRPYIVSCSLGGQQGGRDGHGVTERQLDARFPAGAKGKALCIAAGNEGTNKVHAQVACGTSDSPGRIEWQIHPETHAEVTVYFDSLEAADLMFGTVGETPVNMTNFGVDSNPLSRNIALFFPAMKEGSYAIDLWTKSGKPVAADAYISWGPVNKTASPQTLKPSVFMGLTATSGRQIASPGAARQAITVGSYDYNDQFDLFNVGKATYGNAARGVAPLVIGGISDYSNPGPLRIGNVVKPDLAAPGRFHPVAFAQDAPPKGFMEKSRRYWYMDGTSSATPYVAGVIALMFEKNPGLTVDQVRSLLRSNLTRDRFTGSNPGAAWGHGKLDLRAVRAAIAAVPSR